MGKNKSQSQSLQQKKNYIPPKIIPLTDALQVETSCGTGDGAGCGGPCELCCDSGNGPGSPPMIA